jgi:uncharacterized repeat protein (TIGR03803 family)
MATPAVAQLKILHNFGAAGFAAGGNYPLGGLIFDNAGNLYGTTQGGGTYNGGTVYEFTPNGSGGGTEKVLYNFNINAKDGYGPEAGLVFDGAGNLYGTTNVGGTHGVGTVYELSPNSDGSWTEEILHNFSGADGGYPTACVILDAAGNLYGTASQGGGYNAGVVFELKHGAGGVWGYKVLYNFSGTQGTDGAYPIGGLIWDAAGNLYGTTQDGGTYNGGRGTVFELHPRGGGSWGESIQHNFGNGQDGEYPQTSLMFDSAGNLYGTTYEGGARLNGTVFKMTPTGGGSWSETVLYNFNDSSLDEGVFVSSGVMMDSAGNLYGETAQGSGSTYYGSVFELTPGAGGAWTETQLGTFFKQTLGNGPQGGLVFDSAGNLYGTTQFGGPGGGGTLFEVTP